MTYGASNPSVKKDIVNFIIPKNDLSVRKSLLYQIRLRTCLKQSVLMKCLLCDEIATYKSYLLITNR